MKKAEAYWPLILLLALIKFVLPAFLVSDIYELHRDEYLYYEQGQHFALGYLENPPILSWMGMISSWFGGSEAWIKFWPALLGAATVVITCLLTAEFGGGRFAQFLAGLGIMTGAYMRIHYLFQPNALDIFSWTLAAYFIVRYINDRKPAAIYGLALSLAFGWWCKYSVLFMVIAVVAGLLLSRHRKIFLNKHTWLAALLALILIAPNLYWQYQHNWPLVHHMKELRETQLGYISKTDFLAEQLLLLLPLVFVWIAGLVWLLRNSNYRVIAFIYLIVITLLLFGSGKGYYALGAYPMLLAAGAVAWQNISQKRIWIRWVLTLLIVGFTYLIAPLLLPHWEPAKVAGYYKKAGVENKWEDQENHELSQDFADMLGWKELAQKAEKFYTSLPDSTKANTIIFCDNYGQAGALKYYGSNHNFTKKVFSASGSFILWMPEKGPDFKNILLVDEEMPEKDHGIFSHFERMTIADSVTNPYSRQLGNKIIFYENVDTAGLRFTKERLEELKKRFIR